MSMDPIVTAFSELAAAAADRPLVVSPSRRATVAEIDALADTVAAELERAGLGQGDLVALAAPNGPGFLAALVGLRRRGCVALLVDWRTPAEEMGRIGARLGAAGALTASECWPESFRGRVTRASRRPSDELRVPAGTGVVKLTSGSTGSPRGILTPARCLVADDGALAGSMDLDPDERILAAVPMSHSYGLSSIVMPALMRGSVLVVPEGEGPFDAMVATQRCEVSFLPTVPAYVSALMRMSERPPMPASLRLVITAGAPLSPDVARLFRLHYGCGVHVFYGSSECGGITFDRTGTAGERGTLGAPVHGVEIRIGEADDQGVGVVTVSSPSVAAGYHPDPGPELERGTFTTSDLGRFRDGELVLLGRTDDMINVKGKKVNPREVEQVVSALEGVHDVVVVGVRDRDGEAVRAVVACREGEVDRAGVEAWCRARLAAHKMPRSVILVGEIPRTARGKVDRAALRRL